MAEQSKSAETSEVAALEEGKILDYISGKPLKDSAKEQVRQRIARALFHEYGISVDDMEPDFKFKIDGRNKKVDIAIFEAGADHIVGNLRRVVVCDKEPKNNKKGAFKMREHDQEDVWFDRTPCNFGGERLWFQCPLWPSGSGVVSSRGAISV